MSDGFILFGERIGQVDGTRFEVLNLQLGQGNDNLVVEDTLQVRPIRTSTTGCRRVSRRCSAA
jgi:hypothetical protein